MFGRVISLPRPCVLQPCLSVYRHSFVCFSSVNKDDPGIPRLFNDEAIKNLYSLTPEERDGLQSRGALNPAKRMRDTAKEMIAQRLEAESVNDMVSFQVNPFDRAAEAYNKIAVQGLQHYQHAREQANAQSGFNYPSPRFIPKEARPETLEEVHSGIGEANMQHEDYELAWYRYTRILRQVPDTCKSTFIPFVGITQEPEKEIYDLQKFTFLRDANTLGMMLYTCLAAKDGLYRLHNEEIMQDVELQVKTYKQDGVLMNNMVPKQYELPKTEEKKRITSKNVRKLDSDSEQEGDLVLSNEEMPVEPVAKIVINEDGVGKSLSGDALTQFHDHLSMLHDNAEAQHAHVMSLRKRIRSEVFGELQYAFSEQNIWTNRLSFISQDIIDHYKFLLYETNADLYALLYNNIVADKTSISGNDSYIPSIGNDLSLLKTVMDAARSSGQYVLYCEALTLYMHFNVYLETPPNVKARKLKLHKRFYSDAVQAGTTTDVSDYTQYTPSVEEQARIDQIDATMVKIPIVYFGQHTTNVMHLNDFKRLKYIELSPLCCLLRREEVMDIVSGLQEVAEAHKEYMESHGMDERLLFLPEILCQSTLLGQNSGIRQVVTSMTMYSVANMLLDGFQIDYTRQHEIELPLDYIRMVQDTSKVTIREQQADETTSQTQIPIYGTIYKTKGTRELKWKDRKKELTFDKLMEIPVGMRMGVLANEHEGLRSTNILSRIFTQYPSMMEDYIHTAIHSKVKVNLGKALVLWRKATMLHEWTKIRLNNSLYADMAKDVDPVQQMQDEKHQRTALLSNDDDNENDINNEDNVDEKKRKLSADMRRRLEGAAEASHLPLTTDRMIALLELTQYLAYKKINFINVGLSTRIHANCYTDEISTLWVAAKAMLDKERSKVPKDMYPPGFTFAITDRAEEELLPFELEFAKIGLMILENMVLEQNIPSAQIFSKQLHTLGLVQRQVQEEFFDGIDVELEF